jgi:hypothetical protein
VWLREWGRRLGRREVGWRVVREECRWVVVESAVVRGSWWSSAEPEESEESSSEAPLRRRLGSCETSEAGGGPVGVESASSFVS